MHRKKQCGDREMLGEKHQATHRGGEATCSVPGKCRISSHEDLVGN